MRQAVPRRHWPICPPLAAALEGLALTLTEVAATCHLILAIFGKGSWADFGLDLIALASRRSGH